MDTHVVTASDDITIGHGNYSTEKFGLVYNGARGLHLEVRCFLALDFIDSETTWSPPYVYKCPKDFCLMASHVLRLGINEVLVLTELLTATTLRKLLDSLFTCSAGRTTAIRT